MIYEYLKWIEMNKNTNIISTVSFEILLPLVVHVLHSENYKQFSEKYNLSSFKNINICDLINQEISVSSEIDKLKNIKSSLTVKYYKYVSFDFIEEIQNLIIFAHKTYYLKKKHSSLFSTKNIDVFIDKYIKFLKLRKKYPTHDLYPTFDILLIWKTHQLIPNMYYNDCIDYIGNIVPTINTSPYSNDEVKNLRMTSRLWFRKYRTSINNNFTDIYIYQLLYQDKDKEKKVDVHLSNNFQTYTI